MRSGRYTSCARFIVALLAALLTLGACSKSEDEDGASNEEAADAEGSNEDASMADEDTATTVDAEPAEETAEPAAFGLTSETFADGAPIPERFTGDGDDISPALAWEGLPEGTVELALICDDPDAPTAEPFVHWVIWGIDPASGGLPEAVEASETVSGVGVQGANGFGGVGYRGPAPPPADDAHRYEFRLYALSEAVTLDAGVTKADLLDAIEGITLDSVLLTGTYDR